MNCDWVKANSVLYWYDELADDERHELEQHVERCADCAAQLKEAGEFKTSLAVLERPEPSPNLLAASRLRLQEALETAEQHPGWRRWVLEPASWLRQIKLAPAAAVLLFIFGFGGGVLATYRIVAGGRTAFVASPSPTTSWSTAVAPAEPMIAGITGITPQAGSNKVDIRYDTLVPQQVQGSLDDPRIQQLLLFAARNNTNSGLRMNSVDLLTQKPDDEKIREALMYALRYDSNPGVRLKALEGLGPYVKADIRVRNALLEALMNDSNPGVRHQSIQKLRSVRADASVRQVLQHLAKQDQNTSIRDLSRSVLASTPPID